MVLPSDDEFTLGLTELSVSGSHGGADDAHQDGLGGDSDAQGYYAPSPQPQQRQAAGYMRPPPVGQGQALMSSRFASDHVQAEIRHVAYLEQAQLDPNSEEFAEMPEMLNQYHSLVGAEEEVQAPPRLER